MPSRRVVKEVALASNRVRKASSSSRAASPAGPRSDRVFERRAGHLEADDDVAYDPHGGVGGQFERGLEQVAVEDHV